MSLSRRSFLLTAGLLGAAGSSVLTACGSGGSGSGGGDGKELDFWYWSGAISDTVVKDVAAATTGTTITPSVIGGDFKQKLTTTLSAGQSVPDITGVKGEDMPSFLTQADAFLDLNELGAKDIASTFSAAKYAAAATKEGKQIGLPIDLGPTATFLRADLWEKAGLPSDPTAAGQLVSTWDGWFEVAAKLGAALPGTFAIRNTTDVFAVALAQQASTFVSQDGAFAGDGGTVKTCWDLAVKAKTAGLSAGIYDGTGFNQALTAGTLTGHLGPAWNGLDIASGAPDTSGSWRVASCPGGPANIGGSYLTLTTTCRNPKVAFEYIKTLLDADNAAKSFTDASVFPATTAAYALPALTAGEAFYGGQATIDVFGPAAQALPTVYDDPNNAAISAAYYTELTNVDGGKDATTAWNDAVAAAKQIAQRAGVQ